MIQYSHIFFYGSKNLFGHFFLWPKEMPSFEPQQGKEVIQASEDCLERLESLGWKWGKSWRIFFWVIPERPSYRGILLNEYIGYDMMNQNGMK